MQDYQDDMDDYQKDVEAYQAAMKDYQDDIDEWQTRYKDWKEKRDKAIGEAEGLIERLYKDYGSMFRVSLTHHWGVLVAIMAVLFGLVFVVQQRKDVV